MISCENIWTGSIIQIEQLNLEIYIYMQWLVVAIEAMNGRDRWKGWKEERESRDVTEL